MTTFISTFHTVGSCIGTYTSFIHHLPVTAAFYFQYIYSKEEIYIGVVTALI